MAQAGFNTQGFLLGEPMSIKDLVASLVGHLSSQPPGESTDRLLGPQTLRLLIDLWPETGHPCAAGIPMADAVAACQRLGAGEARARALLNEMAALKLVEVRDAVVWLDTEWRPWLERLWSGDLVDLEVTSLPPGEFDQAELRETREQLLFVGPRGRRVLCRLVDGAHFRDLAPGSPPPDGQGQPALALSFLDSELLAGLLEETLAPESSDVGRSTEEASGQLSAPRC